MSNVAGRRWDARLIFLSMTCQLLAACGGAGGPAQAAAIPSSNPQAFAFQPGMARYLSASHTTIDQEIQGQLQRSEMSVRYRMSVNLLPVDTGFAATFTIDTVLVAEGPTVVAGDLAQAAGRTFTANLAPTGRLADVRGGESTSQFLRQIFGQVSDFFPRLPTNGATQGLIWIDTTEIATGNNGSDITIRAITRHEAGEWGPHEAQRALPVNWTRTYTLTGTGEQLGQPFTLDGTGETRGLTFLSADGRYLGSVAADARDIEVLLTGVGMTIPLRQVRADTVRILP
jgi:hypothetical protein